MANYFSYFPTIRYRDKLSLNLLKKTKILDNVINRRSIYYSYVIQDGDRADTLAYRFYGDAELDWVIYLTNEMIDPYYSWPLNYREFNDYLRKKYNKAPFSLKNDISHYVYTGLSSDTEEDIARKSWTLTPETYEFLSSIERSGWTSVSIYDYEEQRNEDKRVIRIIERGYLNQIIRELEKLLNE